MSGTTWSVTHDGKALTWERLVALWWVRRPEHGGSQQPTPLNAIGTGERLTDACPLAFDVAEDLSSCQAQALLLWLLTWLPATGHGLRLVPSIPTSRVAEMAPGRLAGKPVRI